VIVLPAIDLIGGFAVRLRAGKFEDRTVYSERPWELAASWERAGARTVHVVDLDAARGVGSNEAVLSRIRASTSLSIQFGGGLRTVEAAERALASGAHRVVVGTLAIRRPDDAAALCRAHPGQVVVAVDAKDGKVAIAGWQEATAETPLSLARRAASWGAAAALYTDVARDGLESGPDLEGTAMLAREAGLPILASGGVATLGDLRRLAALRPAPEAVVVGRALLEGRFDLGAAIEAAA
jgi:phosphoribosylformimino-5-aminoimidazole carboxamide ribotide isomerase